MVKIAPENVLEIARGADREHVDSLVQHQDLLARYGINAGPQARRRVSHFLAHVAHETQGLTRLEENLYYVNASRLMAVWPSRFRDEASARPFLRNPEKLANSVYANRLGNGPPLTGDGWKYRGSGCIMTTGRTNYEAVERATSLPVVRSPYLLRRFPEALEAACIFWRDNDLNRFADRDDVAGLTRAIQGGTGGLADRQLYTRRALAVEWGKATGGQQPSVRPVLRRGARGRLVTELQELLRDAGFDPGHIDGIFGPGTEAAVVAFQKSSGLVPDGVVGPATWPALLDGLDDPGEPPDDRRTLDVPKTPAQYIMAAIMVVILLVLAFLFGPEILEEFL